MAAWLAVFLTTATTSAVARLAARGEPEAAGRAAGAAYLAAAVGGTAAGVLLAAAAPLIGAILLATRWVVLGRRWRYEFRRLLLRIDAVLGAAEKDLGAEPVLAPGPAAVAAAPVRRRVNGAEVPSGRVAHLAFGQGMNADGEQITSDRYHPNH
jgi:hypothetical protein